MYAVYVGIVEMRKRLRKLWVVLRDTSQRLFWLFLQLLLFSLFSFSRFFLLSGFDVV